MNWNTIREGRSEKNQNSFRGNNFLTLNPNKEKGTNMSTKKGDFGHPGMKILFTLIELLVVIAIIAILASLLLPALSKARLKSMGIACASQGKNIGAAVSMYCSDNVEFFPHLGTYAYDLRIYLNTPSMDKLITVPRDYSYPCNPRKDSKIWICPTVSNASQCSTWTSNYSPSNSACYQAQYRPTLTYDETVADWIARTRRGLGGYKFSNHTGNYSLQTSTRVASNMAIYAEALYTSGEGVNSIQYANNIYPNSNATSSYPLSSMHGGPTIIMSDMSVRTFGQRRTDGAHYFDNSSVTRYFTPLN